MIVELINNQHGRSTSQWERTLALLLGQGTPGYQAPSVGFWEDLGNPGRELGIKNAEGPLAGATDQLLQENFPMLVSCMDMLVYPGLVWVLGQGIGFSLTLT